MIVYNFNLTILIIDVLIIKDFKLLIRSWNESKIVCMLINVWNISTFDDN